MQVSRSHDEAVIETMRQQPEFAAEYFKTAFEEIGKEKGQPAFLSMLRRLVEARGGLDQAAARAGIAKLELEQALSENGDPSLSLLAAVVRAVDLNFAVMSVAAAAE